MAEQRSLVDPILALGFGEWPGGHFSDGTLANNKVNADHYTLSRYPSVHRQVVDGLGEIASQFDVDCVVGIPGGATGYATDLTRWAPTEPVEVRLKKLGGEQMALDKPIDEIQLGLARRVMLIEDVMRTGSNLQQAMKVADIASKVVVIAAVFDRSNPNDPSGASYGSKPVKALASRYIPAQLPEGSSLLAAARQLSALRTST